MNIIVDTGPLVSFLLQEELRHRWVAERFQEISAPMYTCEPVLTEVFFFLRKTHHGIARYFDLLESGLISVEFNLMEERVALKAMIAKYEDVPMSLADACLVRMAERMSEATILTLDSDFHVYRKHGKHSIPLILPTGR